MSDLYIDDIDVSNIYNTAVNIAIIGGVIRQGSFTEFEVDEFIEFFLEIRNS